MRPSLAVKDIAKIAHENNRALCAAFGDDSQLPWEDAPEWQRQSAMTGVLFLHTNPDAPVSATHDSWSQTKVEEGWVWGEVKDPEAKTHPCLIPFDELPPYQQAKDHIFRATVLGLLKL